ncbi:helix-turn-helix domain-containing GNAT family N-acetyltransferase [Nocardioides dongkuii]|uniref:helix-turn-helix domain-containing GNAT family N-acetyltransferase n=1 Tax=Nocardioides dongkuii TaxID=2760089 RepID=UPI0015FC8FE3|nr:helix-turn-helix domain-containing GNAT family N-acetyltransferase [Nocardioides dongkuii]
MTSATATLRRFNRSYTQRIGALDESFLGLDLPLGTARVLFEVGDGAGVQELRARLGLDSGYLSRVLRRLEERGLVEVAPDPDDRRRRTVTPTAAGRRTRRTLDERSEALAARLLAPLSDRQRDRLTEALATADLLVRAATVSLGTVDPASATARAATAQYFAELDRRFPGGFDPGDTDDVSSMAAPAGAFVVAVSDGAPVACGGVQPIGEGVGEVKRMWVDDAWRGAGLGSRLLRRLEDEALRRGYGVVRLDTHRTLTEALAMYARAGYVEIDRYNDNPYAQAFFEKRLTAPAPAGPSR